MVVAPYYENSMVGGNEFGSPLPQVHESMVLWSITMLMNRRLAPSIDTVFLMANEEYSYVSSRLVKEVARLRGDLSGLVPEPVRQRLVAKF